MKVFHSWDKTLQEPFLTKHLKLLISGKDVFPSWNFPNTAPTRSYLLFLSWSQILWMEGLPCIEKNEFPYFLKICRKLGDQVGYSLHLLHCRLFCDKSKSQKRVKIWMIQDIRDYCVEEGQQVTYKRFANARKIVAVQTKKNKKIQTQIQSDWKFWTNLNREEWWQVGRANS